MKLRNLAVAILSLTIFTACNKTGGHGADVGGDILFNNQKASCGFAANEGETLPTVGASSMESPYFEKSININGLNAVLKTSSNETLSYIRSQNISLYKFELGASKRNCFLYGSLPAAPAEVVSLIEGANDDLNEAESEATVIGLYLPSNSKLAPVSKDGPSIYLNEGTSRWTLVHEFTHHLFHSARAEVSIPDTELQDGLETALNDYNELKKKAEEKPNENLEAAVNAFKELNRLGMYLTDWFSLEEMSVESLLSDKYEAKNFSFVPNELENSAAYVLYSYGKASKYFTSMEEEIDDLKQYADGMAQEASLKAAAEQMKTDLDGILVKYAQRKEVMATLKAKAKTRYESFQSKLISSALVAGSIKVPDCPHSKWANDFIDQISK